VDEPAAGSADATDLTNRNAIDATLRELGLGPAGFVNPTPDFCLSAVELSVPLRRRSSGALRPAKRRVTVTVATDADLEDRDTVLLQCRPGS